MPALAEEPDFGPELLTAGGRMRPGGESLVGVSIALLGRGDGFASRFERVRGFRDDGAEWGLVALDQCVAEGRLVAAVEAAYARAIQPSREAAAPAPDGSPVVTPTTAAAPGAGTGPTTGASPPTTTPSASGSPPTTTAPPDVAIPPLPETPPPGGEGVLPDTGIPVLDDVIEPIDDLLGGILGG